MSKARIAIFSLLFVAITIVIFAIAIFPSLQTESPELETVSLPNEFGSNSFRFAYPEAWQYRIPQPNVLLLASTSILEEQRGTAMTIQRNLNLTYTTDTLEEALTIYLERGPLRSEDSWTITDDVTDVMFNGREALFIGLEGADVEGAEIMRAEVTITRADNGNIYIFAATTPLELWETQAATIEAILDSVEILE